MPNIRVVKSRDEFEGEIYESLAVVEGSDLPARQASEERPEIGKPRTRIDGVQRVTGRATYTHDIVATGAKAPPLLMTKALAAS